MSESVSIAICTKDRPEDLERTLHVLITTHPASPFLNEILIVDNSATGTAKSVVTAARRGCTHRISYYHAATPGVSAARTRALREAQGDILIFVDDDMDVSSDFVESHTLALREYDVAVSLGRIIPDLGAIEQDWLIAAHSEMLGGPSGRLDLGATARLLPNGPAGFGGNTAIRVACVPPGLVFPDALGWSRNGDRLGSEDTYFFGKLARKHGSVYTPQASVLHRVPASRLGPEYFRLYNIGHGRASIRLTLLKTQRSRAWLVLVIITQSMKWFRYLWPVKFVSATKRWVRISKRQYALGKILESFRLLLHPRLSAEILQQSGEADGPPSLNR